MKLGSVVYNRADLYPAILTNAYFSRAEDSIKEWRENALNFGLANSHAGDQGMALLEGLVAATEVSHSF